MYQISFQTTMCASKTVLRDIMKKKVCIIYTGGTIGMKKTPHGYDSEPGYLQDYLLSLPEITHPEIPELHFIEYDPLLDSVNIAPENWNALADTIVEHYDDFDGFVVLHGTDTMAFTASALSFMLEDLGKPVILTGSQIPVSELRSDGVTNLLGAITIAAHYSIPEVCLYFDKYLLRGNRSKKIDSNGFGAFKAPNFSALAKVGVNIDVRSHLLLPNKNKPLKTHAMKPCNIATVRLYPGISESILKHVVNQDLQALIIETYGTGNVPSNNEAVINLIKQTQAQNIIAINKSQCIKGKVNMDAYATGEIMRTSGMLSASGMTIEAVITKLYYLLSRYSDADLIRELFVKNLRGERQ